MGRKTEKEQIEAMKETIAELKRRIAEQDRLIAVMRTMAPIVEVKDDVTPKVRERVPKKNRRDALAASGSKASGDSRMPTSDGADTSKLEEAGPESV
jgi:hypothetical protein